jgi:hypothetical protein
MAYRVNGVRGRTHPWRRLIWREFLLCAAITAIGLGYARAQEGSQPIRLELNRLEPQGDNCRAYLLVDNGRGEAFRSLKVDLFALDSEGVAQRRLAVEVGPLPARKTQIRLFDFAGLACSRFGRVLLNDVIACESASGPHEECLARIETASRVGSVAFAK